MSDQVPESPPESTKDIEPKPSGHAAWRWPLVVVFVALFGLIAFVYILRIPGQLVESAGKGVVGVAEALDGAAAKLLKGTITETFTASLPKLETERGGLLELSKVTATETFRSKDELSYDFRWFEVDVGTTITEIRVPVTYRYHLRMRDAWQLSVTNAVCIVHAPAIRPSQPPAIHTDRMEKSSDEGWARFNAEEQMTKLEQTITPTLRKYAGDEQHLDVIRENCRKNRVRIHRGLAAARGPVGRRPASCREGLLPGGRGTGPGDRRGRPGTA